MAEFLAAFNFFDESKKLTEQVLVNATEFYQIEDKGDAEWTTTEVKTFSKIYFLLVKSKRFKEEEEKKFTELGFKTLAKSRKLVMKLEILF